MVFAASLARPTIASRLYLAAAAMIAWAAPATAQAPYDGVYVGTGRLLSGAGCAGRVGVAFPVMMRIAGGQAVMALVGANRGIAGPVAADGGLQRLAWFGDTGVTDRSAGRVTDERFELAYTYDWASAGASHCAYRYEGRRQP